MRGRFNRIIFEWSRYRELPRRKRIVSKWSIGVGVVGGSGLWSTKGKVTGVDSCGIVGTMLECFMRDWPPPYGRGNDPLFRKLNYHVASNNFLPSPSILLRRFFPFFIADFSFRSRLSLSFSHRVSEDNLIDSFSLRVDTTNRISLKTRLKIFIRIWRGRKKETFFESILESRSFHRGTFISTNKVFFLPPLLLPPPPFSLLSIGQDRSI